MSELIELIDLEKRYGKRIIFKNLNLKVDKGDFVSIGGESGQGKTTLLNIIGMLDDFQKGNYYFDKEEIKGKRIKIRSERIGFIFQDYCLLESLSVIDNILMPFFYSDIVITSDIYDKINEYLEKFNLYDLGRAKAKYLSGGEKQRVSIIRAMIRKPSLVLADEPTGNLDPKNADIISKELRKMANEGTTVIVVTHNQEVFGDVDKKYRLADGRLYNE